MTQMLTMAASFEMRHKQNPCSLCNQEKNYDDVWQELYHLAHFQYKFDSILELLFLCVNFQNYSCLMQANKLFKQNTQIYLYFTMQYFKQLAAKSWTQFL